MPRGQVKWFDPKKGYGFIVAPDGRDVFVHYSHIQAEGFKALKDGEWVDYELVEGEKGYQARNVVQNEGAQPTDQPVRPAEPDEQPISRGYEGADGTYHEPPEEDQQEASAQDSSGYSSEPDERG